ncbi:hypothetical protein HK098_007102 [Nowakowskiella sp. JEL0407]|nr:hypothetical protein HK098_007102 [Nowakowskiella sp. JEL0407]
MNGMEFKVNRVGGKISGLHNAAYLRKLNNLGWKSSGVRNLFNAWILAGSDWQIDRIVIEELTVAELKDVKKSLNSASIYSGICSKEKHKFSYLDGEFCFWNDKLLKSEMSSDVFDNI